MVKTWANDISTGIPAAFDVPRWRMKGNHLVASVVEGFQLELPVLPRFRPLVEEDSRSVDAFVGLLLGPAVEVGHVPHEVVRGEVRLKFTGGRESLVPSRTISTFSCDIAHAVSRDQAKELPSMQSSTPDGPFRDLKSIVGSCSGENGRPTFIYVGTRWKLISAAIIATRWRRSSAARRAAISSGVKVVSLLEAIGSVSHERNGKLKVTLGPETEVLPAPQGKDVDIQILVDLRRMLAQAGSRQATLRRSPMNAREIMVMAGGASPPRDTWTSSQNARIPGTGRYSPES